MTPQALRVSVGATPVGTLAQLGHESVLFSFDRAYVEDSERPTLSLGFKAPDGGIVEPSRPTRVRLLPFFSNLLPEAHLREYLAARGGIHPEREFSLLWLLGADLPGAVRVESVDGTAPPREDGGETDTQRHRRVAPFRFSLAGVQLKFSALMASGKGLTIPATGVGGNWIVKLPSPRYDAVPQNEFAMMTLAAAVGLDVPHVRLVKTASIRGLPNLPEALGQSLAVRRFDRPRRGVRTHIEDFAQVFGVYPDKKYDRASYGNIARVLWLETGEAGLVEFARRLAFSVAIGNGDAHLKNWSLIYADGRQPQLAPAYDLVATGPYIPTDHLGLSLGGTKEFAKIDAALFRRFAEHAGVPSGVVVKAATAVAAAVRDIWRSHEPIRALPPAIRRAFGRHIERVKL